MLPELEAATGGKVALRTVQEWRHRDRWDERLALESLAASEGSVIRHVVGLRVAAPEAIEYLRSIVSGSLPPDAQRIQAARALISENRAIILAAVDHLGKGTDLPAVSEVALDGMTDAELLAYQEKLRQGEE